MIVLKKQAHAKLNLTLDVVGKRPDGYHDLSMVMQEITLGDELTVYLDTGAPWRVLSDSGEIPCDESNLAVKAAKLFFEAAGLMPDGMTIELKKRTPVCAGMGGGSADGAGVLSLLQAHYGAPLDEKTLYAIAEKTGSDVPFALFGGTALAEEKGQVLTRLPSMPQCEIVLCKPGFPVSTPALFRAIDEEHIAKRPDNEKMRQALAEKDLRQVSACLYNVFEPLIAGAHPEITEIRETMCAAGALNACMTGSGPTVFGIFENRDDARRCYETLKRTYSDTYLTNPV